MGAPNDVVMIIGSLCKDSWNRRVSRVLPDLAPPSILLEEAEIRDLPLYDEDQESAPYPAWLEFRQRITRANGILFITPEYNRSIPGGLKNAVDVGSRPADENVWDGKPAAVISVSPGAIGGFGAHHHLRQSLVSVNVAVMPQPEIYIGGVESLFDDAGTLTSEDTRSLLRRLLESFSTWIDRNAKR